ncbi:MAG: hypothetical protein IT285_09430 [Bdellovibrionales bacterium]|nr:hypothetical protein [Bdellovibrionales bacterium]
MRGAWKGIVGAFVFTLLVYGMRFGGEWLGGAFEIPVSLSPLDEGYTWNADLSGLPEGPYLASFGHLTRPCEVLLDGRVMDATKTAGIPFRTGSNLSAPFAVGPAGGAGVLRPRELSIRCERAYVADRPRTVPNSRILVLPYRIGVLVRAVRELSHFTLGPLLSVFLVVTFGLQFLAWNRDRGALRGVKLSRLTDLTRSWPLLAFSVSGLMHGLISADIGYYFLSEEVSPYLYVFSRNFLNFSLLALAAGHTARARPIHALMGASVASGLIGWGLLTWGDKPLLVKMFAYQMYFYTLSTGVAAGFLFLRPRTLESTRLMQSLVGGWLLLQIPTVIFWFSGVRILQVSAVQGMITVSTVILILMRYRELARQERVEAGTARILGAIESGSDIKSLLIQISSMTAREVHYRRVSAYLDAFVLGGHDRPGEVFLRVMEQGYRKDTVRDGRVSFGEGRGGVMHQALVSGEVAAGKGERDGAGYMVVPIGKHACINLSDETAVDDLRLQESRDVVMRLVPALRVLEDRLASTAIRQGMALERIRSARGDGRWECEVGAVFADVNDYSVLTERFGAPFVDFLTTVYFPALVKAVSRWAVPEFVRGDELYLVSIGDLLPEGVSVRAAALEAVRAVRSFSEREGATLCGDHGFPALTLSIGANSGLAWLVCDPIKVRTAGRVVNDAKRLQEAAPSGGILVHAEGFALPDLQGFDAGAPRSVLVKKNCIPARPVKLAA